MKKEPKKGKRGWGEGAIDALPSGRFRARGSVPDGSGARKRVAKVFDSLDLARAWLASLRVEKARGAVVAVSPLTLAQWAGEWLLAKKSSTGAGNFRNYDDHLRLHVLPSPGPDPSDPTKPLPALGPVKLRDLTAARLKRWLADLDANGRTPATRRKACATLSTVLADAVAEGKLAANPLKGKAVPRPKAAKAPVEVWTADELRRFLAATEGTRLHALFVLLADTGLRPGEALGLHWPDVDLEAGTVRVRQSLEEVKGRKRLKEPKTAAGRRVVTLSAITVEVLRAHQAKRERGEEEGGPSSQALSGPVFVSPVTGTFYGKDGFRAAFQRAVRKSGVPERKPYALRHTSATLLLAAGVNVRTVSRRLGHEDIAVTLRHYAGFLPDDDSRAAAAMGAILSGEKAGK